MLPRCSPASARYGRSGDSPGDGHSGSGGHAALRPRLCIDQPAAHRGHAQPADGCVDVGATHFIAQGFAGWTYGRTNNGGKPIKTPRTAKLKTEEDPLDPDPPKQLRTTLDALKTLEQAVLSEGRIDRHCAAIRVVLRAAYIDRERWLHRAGSAAAQAAAGGRRRGPVGRLCTLTMRQARPQRPLQSGRGGVYNVADDEPSPVSEWLSFLAHCAHAQPPRQVPAWLAKLLIGEHVVAVMNEIRGVSNAKIKSELDWTPRWPSWREGFRDTLKNAPLPVRELFGTTQLESRR